VGREKKKVIEDDEGEEDFREHAVDYECEEQHKTKTDVQSQDGGQNVQDHSGITVAIPKTMTISRTMRRSEERMSSFIIDTELAPQKMHLYHPPLAVE